MPKPVFMASIIYESLKDKKKLEEALTTIAREDNSFHFREDKGKYYNLINIFIFNTHIYINNKIY